MFIEEAGTGDLLLESSDALVSTQLTLFEALLQSVDALAQVTSVVVLLGDHLFRLQSTTNTKVKHDPNNDAFAFT